jgi:hypothetical protein
MKGERPMTESAATAGCMQRVNSTTIARRLFILWWRQMKPGTAVVTRVVLVAKIM